MLRDASRPSGGPHAEPADYLSEASPWDECENMLSPVRAVLAVENPNDGLDQE